MCSEVPARNRRNGRLSGLSSAVERDVNAVRLLIDARKAGDGGIGVYLDNLITGLIQLQAEGTIAIECFLLVPPVDPGVHSDEAGASSDSAAVDRRAIIERWATHCTCIEESAGKYSIAEYFTLAYRHRALFRNIDLFHSPHYTLPFFLPMPRVVTIHDVIHLQYPESVATRLFAGPLIRSAARRAEAIITVSTRSRQTLLQYTHGAPGGIYVVPNAVSNHYLVEESVLPHPSAQETAIRKPYCLFLGSDRLHKGFDLLLESWERLLSTVDQPLAETIELVVTGSHFDNESRALVSDHGLEGRVRFVGAVPAKDLPHLYRHAEAVIISSREEGFGLPALEAMASGTTVVSTPLPSIREICGEAAWYSDEFDGEALCKAIDDALRSRRVRAEKRALGLKRAKEFSVSSQALKTCLIYETVLCGNRCIDRSIWNKSTDRTKQRLRIASGAV